MSKTVLMAVGGAVAGLGVAAVLFMFVLGGGSSELAAEGEATAEPTPVHVEGRLGPHITLEDRVFTLLSPPTAPRYAKVEIVIEFETTDEEWAEVLHGCVFSGGAAEGVGPCKAHELELLADFDEEIGTGRQLIEDAVTTILSSKTVEDIGTAEGKDQLRQEIHEAVDELIYEPRVTRVLFTSFITQ